jgi:hypothetical protein
LQARLGAYPSGAPDGIHFMGRLIALHANIILR